MLNLRGIRAPLLAGLISAGVVGCEHDLTLSPPVNPGDAVVAQFEPSFAAKGLKAEVSGESTAHVDPDAVGQILGNLLSNVEKYASDGHRVEVEIKDDRMEVRDHGPGVPPEDLRRIFEPFVRLGDKLSDGVTGTGIGLTIAGELARLQGGSLDVERANPGLRFTLRFPKEKGLPS